MGVQLDRPSALELLQQYTKSESLIKHMLAVEACMRAYAKRFEENVEMWGIVGLLHDFDYEMYPNPPDHPKKGSIILKEPGLSRGSHLRDPVPCRLDELSAKKLAG